MPVLVKIDQEMRPWECSQTDIRFYNLSYAICYGSGTDNDDDVDDDDEIGQLMCG